MTSQVPRRELLRAGGAAGLLSIAGCSQLTGGTDGTSVEGWPMYQHDPAHTGSHPTAEGPGDQLDEQWSITVDSIKKEFDPEVPFALLSPPVVADETVYATIVGQASTGDPRETFGGALVAVDASDGSRRWQTILDGGFTTTSARLPQPTILGDLVVAALPGAYSEHPSAVAVDADSGEVQWKSSEPMTITPGTAWDGTVAFGHRTAHALASDGSLVWEYSKGEEPPFALVNAPPTITDDGVYVATREGLHGLDHEGNQVWTRDLAFTTAPYPTPTSPLMPVAGDSLYVTTSTAVGRGDGRLVALDPADGSTRWEFKPEFDAERRERVRGEYEQSRGEDETLSVGVFAPPALHDGTLYAQGWQFPEEDSSRTAPHLFAVDASTGEREWATQTSRFVTGPPVVAAGTVYVATGTDIVAIDAGSGERLASVELDSFPTGFALDGDRLFAANSDEIFALGS